MSKLDFRIALSGIRVVKVVGDIVVCELASAYDAVDPMVVELPVSALGGIINEFKATQQGREAAPVTPVAPVAQPLAPVRRSVAPAAARPVAPMQRATPKAANTEDYVLTEEELAWLSAPIVSKAA